MKEIKSNSEFLKFKRLTMLIIEAPMHRPNRSMPKSKLLELSIVVLEMLSFFSLH